MQGVTFYLKLIGLTFVLALAISTASAFAASQNKNEQSIFLPKFSINREGQSSSKLLHPDTDVDKMNWSVGVQHLYFNYQEPSVMSEIGQMSGLTISYSNSLTPDELWKYRSEGELLFGRLTYDGGTMDGKQKFQRATNDYLLNVRAVGSRQLFIYSETKVGVYSGLGYRYINDRIEGTGSYEREISYLFAPLGFEAVRRFSPDLRARVFAEYDLFIMGNVKSHFEDISPDIPTIENRQKNGYGLRVGGNAVYSAGQWNLLIAPYYQVWNVGDSEPQQLGKYTLLEPKNSTSMYGLTLGIVF